jgi:hypothetical protein
MTIKANWDRPTEVPKHVPLPPAAQAAVDRAAQLTLAEIMQLDVAEGRNPDLTRAAWDLMRDRLNDPLLRSMRLGAREAAWQAATESLVRVGLEPIHDDRAWWAARSVGAGASRAARYAACVLVAPNRVDDEVVEVLLRPWRYVIG